MKKTITVLLICILAMSMLVTNAWAMEPIAPNVYAQAINEVSPAATNSYTPIFEDIACGYGEHYGQVHTFPTTQIMVSAAATNVGVSDAETITIKLERKLGSGFFPVKYYELPVDGVARTIFYAQSVSTSSEYRFTYVLTSGSSDVVSVSLVALPYDN